MKNDPRPVECTAPATVAEALAAKAARPVLHPIAGGTEVMVWMNDGRLPQVPYLSLHRLAGEWRVIRVHDDGRVGLGALTTYTDARHHPHIMAHYPMLCESAAVTGALQIQNRGTWAGNIANGSPAADNVPSLLAYDAVLRLASVRGVREVPLAEFFTGYRKNVLAGDELIAEILLPPRPAAGESGLQYYRKVGTRQAQAISKVVFAGLLDRGAGVCRLAWGSVAPMPMRTVRTEQAVLEGAAPEDAAALLLEEIAPIDDIRSIARYRRTVARRTLLDFLGALP